MRTTVVEIFKRQNGEFLSLKYSYEFNSIVILWKGSYFREWSARWVRCHFESFLTFSWYCRMDISHKRDLEAGRITEVDWLNGKIVRLAEKMGRHAPVNTRLIALIREAEAGGKRRWSGEDLLNELKQAAQS